MIYSNKVLYCLSFISLVVTVRYVSRLKVTMLNLLPRINRLYSLLGGTGNILSKDNGNPINQSSCVCRVTLGLCSLITKEGLK